MRAACAEMTSSEIRNPKEFRISECRFRPSTSRCLELSVPGFEVRGLVERASALQQPCGGPVEHVAQWGGRGAEFCMRERGVIQPRQRTFGAGKAGGFSKSAAQFFRERAHRKNPRAGHIHGHCGRRCEIKALDGMSAGVALPDEIHMAHGEVHRLIREKAPADIDQHPVARFDAVIQPYQRDRSAVAF